MLVSQSRTAVILYITLFHGLIVLLYLCDLDRVEKEVHCVDFGTEVKFHRGIFNWLQFTLIWSSFPVFQLVSKLI
jgi:hypothetical protein